MEAFKSDWLHKVGRQPDFVGIGAALRSYEPWLDIAGTRQLSYSFEQSVDDFVECQHSRATWARSAMGEAPAAAFDADLRDVLRPHAGNDLLHYNVSSTLVWGRPRRQPRRAG